MNTVVCCSYEWFDLLFVCWFVVSGCIAYVLIVLVWLLFLFMWSWLRGDLFGWGGLLLVLWL